MNRYTPTASSSLDLYSPHPPPLPHVPLLPLPFRLPAQTQCRGDRSPLSPRKPGSINSRIATSSDFRRVVVSEMDSPDWLYGFDTISSVPDPTLSFRSCFVLRKHAADAKCALIVYGSGWRWVPWRGWRTAGPATWRRLCWFTLVSTSGFSCYSHCGPIAECQAAYGPIASDRCSLRHAVKNEFTTYLDLPLLPTCKYSRLLLRSISASSSDV